MHPRLKAYVAHRSPGRLRLKIPGARDNAAFFATLKAELARADGVLSVTANPAAASIVVVHDGRVEPLALCRGVPALATMPSAVPAAAASDGAAAALRADMALLLIKLLPFAFARHPLAQLAEVVAEPALRVLVQALTRPRPEQARGVQEHQAVSIAG